MSARPFTRVLVPSGVLGLGFDEDALERALALEPDLVAIDGGSTDSGPHFLGTGTSKYADAVCRGEWRTLLAARARLGVPLVIGSAGTCGTDAQVARMLELTGTLAAERGERLRVTTLRSGQEPAALARALERGDVTALPGAAPLERATLEACTNVVALAGAEQIDAALATGADVVVAGRTTDTALIAARPLADGRHAGAAWHAAKIAECGALCSTQPTTGVVVVDVDDTGFTIRPTAAGARCTPRTVAAHMLYENADPVVLHEPGGHLDVGDAVYTAADERSVRVTGSRWVPEDRYTVKLEGAGPVGHETTLLVLLRDPHYVRHARAWMARVRERLQASVATRLALAADAWSVELRAIGLDATLGALETATSTPHEIGVLCLVRAPTAELADEIARLADPLLLHCPLTDDEPLPTFAFPYSPVATPRGARHEFLLEHVLRLDDPMHAFRLDVQEVGG